MFKEKLKELREKKKISQYELANKIFVSRSAVAKWENGLGMPSEESIELLCNLLSSLPILIPSRKSPQMIILCILLNYFTKIITVVITK